MGGLESHLFKQGNSESTMEKIIVLSDASDVDDTLMALLTMLFPECEIEFLPRRGRRVEDAPSSCKLRPPAEGEMDETN